MTGQYREEFARVRQMRAAKPDRSVGPSDPLLAVLVKLSELADEVEAAYVSLRVVMDQMGYEIDTEEEEPECNCTGRDLGRDCPIHGADDE